MTIRSKVLLALRWSAGLKALSQVATWAMTLIVVRLLDPADYGLMAMASIVIAFLMMVNELGIGPALVQRPSVDHSDFRVAFGIAILSNCALLACLWIAAYPIAIFFDEPGLVPIIRLMSVQFVLIPFAVIPEARLLRALDLKRKSLVDLTANVAGGLTSLSLAASGHGVWSLVWGSLVIMTLRTTGLIIAAPYFVTPHFSIAKARELLSFGALITADRLLWFLYSRVDVIIVGKILGTELLGIYSVAMQIASLPLQKVNSILNEVAFPAFSTIQNDIALIKQYLGKAVRVISFLAFPVFFGLSSISPPFVRVVLGDQWEQSIIPLSFLACIMPLRMASNIMTSTLQGIGRVGVSVGNLLYACALMPIAILIGSQWGLVGACLAWLVAFPVVTVIEIVRSAPYIKLHLLDFGKLFYLPLVGSCIMWASVRLITSAFGPQKESLLALALMIIVGALVYFLFTALFNRRTLAETLALRSLDS